MTVAVTGASGHLGRATARYLLDELDPSEVVLVTRDPSKLDEHRERGVDVRRGDFDDPASLLDAFAGVERLLVISADDAARRAAQHVAAFDAAKAAGVRHVAYTSIVDATEGSPAYVTPSHEATEEALRASGLGWTMLRNSLYADFLVPRLQQAIATGRFVHNQGERGAAFVVRDDCAAVAAAVLAGDGHDGATYDVTGPESLTPDDLAELAAEVGGVEVTAVGLEDDAYIAALVEAGTPEAFAPAIANFGKAIRAGHLERVSPAVEQLTGRPARTLRELVTQAVGAST